jgi:hypothetical protein
MSVIRLATSQDRKPVRACMTCRYVKIERHGDQFNKCRAVSGYADSARSGECNHGELWEAKPPVIPVVVRLKRWLVG